MVDMHRVWWGSLPVCLPRRAQHIASFCSRHWTVRPLCAWLTFAVADRPVIPRHHRVVSLLQLFGTVWHAKTGCAP
jgi:hypothetical protein